MKKKSVSQSAYFSVRLVIGSNVFILGAFLALGWMARADWTQFRFISSQTGFRPDETILSPENVGNLTFKRRASVGGGGAASASVADGRVYVVRVNAWPTVDDGGRVHSQPHRWDGGRVWIKQSYTDSYTNSKSHADTYTKLDSNTNSNTNGNAYCYSYWNSNSNANTQCYTDSDGYSYGDVDGYTDNYAKAHAHAKARTDVGASSVAAAETLI